MAVMSRGGGIVRKGAVVIAVLALLLFGLGLSRSYFMSSGDAIMGSSTFEGGEVALPPSPDSISGSDGRAMSNELATSSDRPAVPVPGNEVVTESPDVIRKATLRIEVENPEPARAEAIAIVQARGGSTFSESSAVRDESRVSVTFKLPPAQYDETMRLLSEIGEVHSRSSNEQVVTGALIDLRARVGNAQASVDRLRALMARANTVGEVISIEGQLSSREGELESLKGRLASLESQVTFSTLTLEIYGPSAEITEKEDDNLDFFDGLKAGWRAMVEGLQVGLAAVGFFTPFVPVVLLGFLAWKLWVRSRAGRES